MKRWRALGAFVGAVGLLIALTMGAEKDDGNEWINGHKAKEVLIKFRDASPTDIQWAKQRGKIVHAEMIGGNKAYRFRPSEKSVTALMNLLAADPKVEYVELNYILYADNLPNDPKYPALWGMPKISAPYAWDICTGLPSVIVGVVDTGIDPVRAAAEGEITLRPIRELLRARIRSRSAVSPDRSPGPSI